MTRTALLLALLAVWFLAPDLAATAGANTAAVTYRANGIFGAVLALLAREAFRAGAPRAVCDMAAYFWIAQPVCDIFWLTEGASTASVCDSVFSIPGTAIASAGLAALAGWIYDRHV